MHATGSGARLRLCFEGTTSAAPAERFFMFPLHVATQPEGLKLRPMHALSTHIRLRCFYEIKMSARVDANRWHGLWRLRARAPMASKRSP